MSHAIMACHALGPDNTSTAGHTYTNDIDRQLKVAIIGAGIAGLSAAVGLRGAGHDVEVYQALSPMISSPLCS